MSLFKQKNSTIWWALLYHDGKRIRESTGTADKKEAQKWHDQRKAELWTTQHRPGGLTWEDALIAWLKAETRSESDRYALRSLKYPNRPLKECTVESFEKAMAGHRNPETYNRYVSRVVAVMNLSGVKLKIQKKKVKEGRTRFLSKEEWLTLHAELPAHLKPLATFAISTGLRQSNVTHLRWDQVDLKRKVMWIQGDKMKAGKALGIPMSDEAVAVLRSQIGKSGEWVFPYPVKGKNFGKPITEIKLAWQLAMERAGLGYFEKTEDGKHKKWIGDFTWHGLRHTWASWHIMSGTPIEVLQKLGGWEDLRMVQRYAHLAPEYLAGFAGNSKPWVKETGVANYG